MREIKFRAWNKKNKEMIVIFDTTTRTEWYLPRVNDDWEVMQFTGLRDKNGMEIYEGDIVEVCRWLVSRFISVKVPIYFINMCWSCGKGKSLFNYSTIEGVSIEVIGNIYENSELLKEVSA